MKTKSTYVTGLLHLPFCLRGLLLLYLIGVAMPAALGASTSGPRLEGWQNTTRRWGSGVQSGNSSYAEDRVVPLRWVGTLKAGSVQTIVLKYDFSANGQRYFFDSLGSFDATEPGVALDQGTTLEGSRSVWPIKPDTSLPVGAQRPGDIVTYNLQKVEAGNYSTVNGVRMLPLKVTVAGTSGNRTVVIAYGAHLAAEMVWGTGRGALQSPGASGKAYASLNGQADLNVAVNPDALSPSANLSIAMTGPDRAKVGEEIEYAMVVSNLGPNSASDVSVSDTLPSGLTFLRATTSVGVVNTSNPVLAKFGTLLPGATARLSVSVRVEAAAVGTVIHSARVASPTPDPVSGNNTASVSTLVEQPDVTPPEIRCPGDFVVGTDPGTCGARVTFSVTATDDRSAASVTTVPPSGSLFPTGTTRVDGSATDSAGNVSTCSFLVTVVDRGSPVIECPPDIVVDVPVGRCDALVTYTTPGATDACDGPVPVTADIPSGTSFPIGATRVTLAARDRAGNTTSCAFTVTVRDIPNDSWPAARPLLLSDDPAVPGVLSLAERQCLTRVDQSRWYRFKVQPGSTLVVTLEDLAANYDLVVFKDIAATYASLLEQTDVVMLNAAFASDAFSPAAFSPDALSPAAFSPAAFSPAAFSPAAFSPAAFSPAAFSPAAFSPAAFSPDAYAPAAFSPAAFSPAAFSPAAFSPAAFSPAQFSPAAFSDAQAQSVIAVSAFDGTASEGVVVKTWDSSTDFYVRVRGRNGAFVPGDPYRLQAFLFPGSCGDLQPTAVDAAGVQLPPTGAVVAGNYRTLILTDPNRMRNDGSLQTMSTRLAALASRPEVQGVVIDLGADPRIAFFNNQADNKLDCPTAKNLVATATKRVVDEWRSLNPSLENIVLVGGDDVIPFFRYPDQALLGPERNYVPPVRDSSGSQASLRLNYVLGQDAYGASCEIPKAVARFPVPDLAVGRLVEHPAEVVAVVDAYLETPSGVTSTPASALVTGYDFLTDAAESVRDELTAGLGVPVDSLIQPADSAPAEGWTAAMLREKLFTSRHDLIFLAGHFSAFGALAADFTTHISPSELLETAVDFKNTLLFSAGCHSGYSAVDADGIPLVTPEPDWAQACARRKATLIAGTGYQYGDTDFIEYSERLYLEFARQLRKGTGPVSIGQALMRAKRRYLATTPVLRGLHEKALVQATLFGLPMLRVNLPSGRSNAPEETDASIVPGSIPFATNPGAFLGLSSADITLTPTFLPPKSLLLDDFENGGQVAAMYLEGRDGVLVNAAEPILPLEIRNVSLPGTTLRGVGFREGTYVDLADIIPLTGAATTEIRGVHVGFPTEVFFPIQPWNVNYFDALCGTQRESTRLALASAQFRANAADGIGGTLRRYDRLSFRLFYNNNLTTYPPGGQSTPGRSGPPSITRVFAPTSTDRVRFSTRVTGNPSAGIQEVWVTYTATQGWPYGRWQSLNLIQSAVDSTVWEGELPLGGVAASDFRYMVQAVNGVGLVALNTRHGRYHVPDFDDGLANANTLPTTLTLVTPPTVAAFGSRITVTAQLAADGQPAEGYSVLFQIADQQATARTGSGTRAGLATATINVATVPGDYDLKVTYPGGFGLASSWTSAPFQVTPATTAIQFDPPAPVVGPGAIDPLTAILTDGQGNPIIERTILFVVQGPGASLVRPAITDYAGRARLGRLDLASGTYAVTAHFASRISNLPDSNETVDLSDPRYIPASQTTSLSLDVDPPVVTALSVTPNILNVPNHKMVPVLVSVAAIDAGGPTTSRIVEIRSNEPANGLGDGDQDIDWQITGNLTANLRSERAQNGTGRIYTLIVETADPLGNTRRDNATVFVPK